jgi:hypothetical protein
MSSSSLKWSGDDEAAFAIALEKFPLAPWLVRRGFTPQGRAKLEYVHDCPWCGAEDKLSVNPTRRFWRCFVCLKRFSLFDLIATFEGGYAQAAEIVRAAVGVRSIAFIPDDWHQPAPVIDRPSTWEPSPIWPPESFTPLTGHIPYTAKRGLDLDNMRALGVGVVAERGLGVDCNRVGGSEVHRRHGVVAGAVGGVLPHTHDDEGLERIARGDVEPDTSPRRRGDDRLVGVGL